MRLGPVQIPDYIIAEGLKHAAREVDNWLSKGASPKPFACRVRITNELKWPVSLYCFYDKAGSSEMAPRGWFHFEPGESAHIAFEHVKATTARLHVRPELDGSMVGGEVHGNRHTVDGVMRNFDEYILKEDGGLHIRYFPKR